MRKRLTAEFEIEEGLIEYEEQKIDELNEILDQYLLCCNDDFDSYTYDYFW